MNVSTTEINGFEIDVFNQYDLKVGAPVSTCPICSHTRKKKNDKCASLDWGRGIGTCHHCGDKFQLHTFVTSDRDYYRPEWHNNTELSDNVIKWFESRGISQVTINRLKVTEGKEWMPHTAKDENTIQFNYFRNGELINTKYRDGRKNFKLVKGAEKIFYNLDSITDCDTVVIVEGEMDVLALEEANVGCSISVPNGATTSNVNLTYLDTAIDLLESKDKIILALDQDEAGINLRNEFIRRLGAEKCYTCDFGDVKDANDYLIRYGSSELRAVVANANPVPLENVVTVKDIEDELNEFMVEGFKPGYQIGLQNFDDIFSTYTGQFITVTGIPSSGKSDWVDQMAVGYNQRYGWKTAFASPENKPTFLHAHKLIRKFWKGMPSKEDLGTERWEIIKSHVDNNFFFLENERYDLDSVLEKGAELVKRKGIKCLVIDPFNKVKMKTKREMSIPDYTMEYLQKIEIFAKKYDVLVVIVAHPTKMYKDANGKIEEPTMYNIKGGGEWYDASYHGLLVHRDYEQKTVKVKVLKVKFQNLGQNGEEAHFKWNHQSGLYEPHEVEVVNQKDVPW